MNETKIPHDNKDIGKDFITKKEMKSKTNYLYSRTGRQFKKIHLATIKNCDNF